MYIPPSTRANIRHLYADIFWFGVLSGSAIGFLAIYAARLGAEATQIGWLTAGPALVNLFISLPVGRWLERRPLVRTTFWTSLAQRSGYLAMAFLPWLFADRLQISALIWLTLLMSVPTAMVSIGFNALFAEVVPADQRADVVGKRNALLALSQTLATLVSGLLLDNIVFPVNYQLVFAIGAAGGFLSSYYISRLRPYGDGRPESGTVNGGFQNGGARQRLHDLREEVRRLADRLSSPAARRLSRPNLGMLHGAFGRFMLSYLLFYTFQYLCHPIFPLAFVYNLNLTDGMISLGTMLFNATMLLVSLRLGPLARRWGDRRLLGISAALFSLYPLILGLGNGPPMYLVASFVGGAIYAVVSVGLINRLMARVPEDQRSTGMAFHHVVFQLGILIGSLSGPLLGEALGIQTTLFVGAGLRVIAGVLLLLWG